MNVGQGVHTVNFAVTGVVNPDCSPHPKTGRRFSHNLINQPPPPCLGHCRRERPSKVKVLPLEGVLTPVRWSPPPADANGGDPSTFVWLMPPASMNSVYGVKSRYRPNVTVQLDGRAVEVELRRAAGSDAVTVVGVGRADKTSD